MILKEDSTEQKLRGAYYTPLKLAEKMVDFFKKDASIKSILEPSCGDGVFVDALVETQFLTQNRKVTAIEIEKNEAQKVAEKLKNNPNVSVENRDFFEFYQKYKDINKYDMILGNPPYIRYQYLEEKQRMEMAEILTSHGMKANKLINTWVGFMVACVHMLSDKNRITKYDWEDDVCRPLMIFDGTDSNNGTKSHPCLQGDIIGDWREEVLLRTEDNSAPRLPLTWRVSREMMKSMPPL